MPGRKWTEVRCTAMVAATTTGRRCGDEALPGTDRCEKHPHGQHADNPKYMHRFYSRSLKPTLAARIGQQLSETTLIQRLDVGEELALLRDAQALRVELYSNLVEMNAADPSKVTLENVMSAGEIMRAGLEDVIRAVELLGRVEKLKQEVAGGFASCMQAVITTVCQCAQRAFENDHRVAEFERLLRDELLAKDQFGQRQAGQGMGAGGTTLTPDMDAAAMDSSVPGLPGPEGSPTAPADGLTAAAVAARSAPSSPVAAAMADGADEAKKAEGPAASGADGADADDSDEEFDDPDFT